MTIPPPAEVTMIGKYQILELAGEGAMGAVYRARDTVLNRFVAIKVMNATIARDTELRDRFLREAQSAGSLQHPNVVTVFDFGEVDGHLFIAMEFVDGSDLEQVMASATQPSLETKLEIIIDALAGLAYAHQRGIVHRDLKPANIRVTTDGRAKLMDFGVAHLESSKMTKTGTMIGTPSYMAPEYISGKPVTTVSDIFSMGAVLYHVVTGVKPFDGDTLHAVLFKVVQEEPPLPSSIVPSIPTALDGIVRRAMAKDPADRFQSALDLATMLTSLRAQMRGLPANETQTLSTTLAHRVASRGAAAARDAAARTNAPNVGATEARVSSTGAVPAALASPEKPKSRTSALVGGVAAVVVIGATSVFLINKPTTAGTAEATVPSMQVASGGVANTSSTPVRTDSAPHVSDSSTAKTEIASNASTSPTKSEATAGIAKIAATKTQAITPASDSSGTSELRRPESKGPSASPGNSVVTPNPAPTSPAPPPSSSVPVVSASPPSTAAAPEVAAARDVPGELRDLVSRYAQAISAHDLSSIRAVYPRLTSEQQRGFEHFFASTKGLQASLSLTSIDVKDAAATGRVSGVYVFTSSSGRNERQAMNFRATFERQGDKWVLSSVQ